MRGEPLAPGEIRLVARTCTIRLKPGDDGYDEMRAFFEPGIYEAGRGRLTDTDLAMRTQEWWASYQLRKKEAAELERSRIAEQATREE